MKKYNCLVLPAGGLIVTIMVLTAIFSIYQGGSIRATEYYARDNKAILSAGIKNSHSLKLSKNLLNWEDGEKIIEKLDAAKETIIASEGNGSLSSDTKSIQAKVMGISHSYWNVDNKKILYGRFIDSKDMVSSNLVAVLNEKASLALFNTRDSIGRTIVIEMEGGKESLSIIGVLQDPYYYEENDCFIPYALFPPETYDSSWVSIAVSKDLLDDSKDKMSKILNDNYGTNAYEAYEHKQLMLIKDWLQKNLMALCSLIIICTAAGLLSLILGLDIYLKEQKDKIYILKVFGVNDDKIMIRFFNKLLLSGFIILLIGVILGYLLALVAGSIIFIKPILSLIHIAIIASYGYFIFVMAMLISYNRFRIG